MNEPELFTETERQEAPRRRPRKPKQDIRCDMHDHLETVGFDMAWAEGVATQYGFGLMEYVHKFRAFRCYKEGQHVDWISINDLALLNNKRKLEEIRVNFQPVSPRRAVIQYPWR
tara:strand:- start:5022 stop:5366 length:345 start_codon:yes stop_codon:yes gene_type:complete